MKELEPWAIKGKDPEYSELLRRMAKYNRSTIKDYRHAVEYHVKAREYDPNRAVNFLGLLEAFFLDKKYEKAYEISRVLIELNYPNKRKALRMGVHCGLQVGTLDEVKKMCDTYLSTWADDPLSTELRKKISEGGDINEMLNLFSRGGNQ